MNPELGPAVAASPKESYHISRVGATGLYKKEIEARNDELPEMDEFFTVHAVFR